MISSAFHGLTYYIATIVLYFDGFRHHLCVVARVQLTDIKKQGGGIFVLAHERQSTSMSSAVIRSVHADHTESGCDEVREQ
jgi:hypothetical protein